MMRPYVQFQMTSIIVRLRRALGYVCAALLLSGCSDLPASLKSLNDYQQRVTNTLDQPAVSFTVPNYPRLPASRDLQVEVPRVSISLLDAWRIESCPAAQLIAERNSALGKLSQGVTRYYGDLLLVDAGRECVATLRAEDPNLAERLAAALQQKAATLEAARQQAIASDDALRHALRMGANGLLEADDAVFAEQLAALEQVVYALEQSQPQSDAARVEAALQTIHQSDYLPSLWRTLQEQSAYLAQLATITDNLAERAGCDAPSRPQRAEILHTVFLKFFIGEVQPQLAAVTAQGQRAAVVLQRLQALTSQPLLQDYLAQLQGSVAQLRVATKTHVQPWQNFFTACEFTPGG
ncbi:DUF3080 family protein [Pseudidiomarina sp. YC-516-91]|uniref:DUF3080 family protein n=1 Tax=Pseudidiomarina salilacus TaxID=3384452 RepID=UPI003984E9E4